MDVLGKATQRIVIKIECFYHYITAGEASHYINLIVV